VTVERLARGWGEVMWRKVEDEEGVISEPSIAPWVSMNMLQE
jgi:hypothetical protein